MSFLQKFRTESVRNVNVWASHIDFGMVLAEPIQFGRKIQYPDGDMHTQAGWHVTLVFSNLADLAAQLNKGVTVPDAFYPSDVGTRGAPPIRPGEINRLAIMAHGDQGGVAMVDGKEPAKADPANALTTNTFDTYRPILGRIGAFTKPTSTILMMGCLAGQGEPGTQLLKLLSAVWAGRNVVGFRTIGYRHPGEMTKGAPNELPGMKETDVDSEVMWKKRGNVERQQILWAKNQLPWASEQSPYAKVVRNGTVLKCPRDEICK
jgi:hypothetical protein